MRSTLLSVLVIALPVVSLNLTDNTWVSANLTYTLPASIPGAVWSTTDGYSGSVYDNTRHRILWRTGVGDNQSGCHLSPGYYSNAWLAWDFSSTTAPVIDVFNWGGGSYGGGCLLSAFASDTTPSPRHTYDGITYVSENDAIYMMAGANWKIVLNDSTQEAVDMLALDNQSTWKYSLAEDKYYRIPGNVNQLFSVSPYESHLRYWPAGHQLLYVDDGGTHHAVFNLSTNTWSNISTSSLKSPFSLYNARSAWDSKRGLWVFRNGANVCVYDPATRVYTQLPGCGISNPSIAYIPKHDIYLVTGATGNDTKVYEAPESPDPIGSGAWKSVAGGSIALPDYDATLQYDSLTDLVALVKQKSTYCFRYVPQSSAIEGPLSRAPEMDLEIRPNPFRMAVTIRSLKGLETGIEIFDLTGRRMESFTSSAVVTWKAENCASGVYLVKAHRRGKHFVTKVILDK